jgi:small subunit ribosomal protein S6
MGEEAKLNKYETLFVLHPDHGPKVREFIERCKKIVEGFDGTITHVEEWGLRELAYRIRKQSKGYYSLLQYAAAPGAVTELERNLKLSEEVLRHLTVRLEEESAGPPVAERPVDGAKTADKAR